MIREIMLALLLVGCGGSDPNDMLAVAQTTDAAVESAPDAAPEHAKTCPADMTLVGAACVDTAQVSLDAYFDWHSDGGSTDPVGCQPGETNLADQGLKPCGALAWCQAHGKRLCTLDEWMPACEARIGAAKPQQGYEPDWLAGSGGDKDLGGVWYSLHHEECTSGLYTKGTRANVRCCSSPK